MEQPAVGMALAFTAGTLDGWTLRNAGTFATVQSGNVITGSSSLVEGTWDKLTFAVVALLCFGIGSMAAGAFMATLLRRGKSFASGILLVEATCLVGLAAAAGTTNVDPRYIAAGISFVAGVQGNAFHKIRGALYGNVAVTLVVQMAFNSLVQSRFSRNGMNDEPNLMWSGLFFSVLLAFAGGGAVGALAAEAWRGWALCIPAGVLVPLGVLAIDLSRSNIDPDPTPGGLIG